MRILIAASALVFTTAPLAAGQHTPAAAEAGPAVDCVRTVDIRQTRVRDDRTIDFVMRSGKVYRNDLGMTCPQLGAERRFSYKTSIGQLCSVDTITVLTEPGLTPGASCGLGKFQPVTSGK